MSMFPKIGVPQNGWFIRKNPIRMDDLGVPLFLETPICRCFNDKFRLETLSKPRSESYLEDGQDPVDGSVVGITPHL